MKPAYASIIFLLLGLNLSCTQTAPFGNPNENPALVLKDFNSFWKYYSKSTSLSEDFIPLDVASNSITKEHFLNYLLDGEFIPLRLTSAKNIYYKLYKIPPGADESISSTVVASAQRELKLFKLEGKPLARFDVTDLNGTRHNQDNTKGKILVLKFWFIHCQKCNEEIPDCNKLVAKYKNSKDISFISLAFDSDADLKKFLAKTTLEYAIAGNQKKYLREDLGIDSYPTHMIINRDGIVSRVVNNFDEVEPAIAKLIAKK